MTCLTSRFSLLHGGRAEHVQPKEASSRSAAETVESPGHSRGPRLRNRSWRLRIGPCRPFFLHLRVREPSVAVRGPEREAARAEEVH